MNIFKKLFDINALRKENNQLKKEVKTLKARIKTAEKTYIEGGREYERLIRELQQMNSELIHGTMEQITFEQDKTEYIKKIPAGYMVEIIGGQKHWKKL